MRTLALTLAVCLAVAPSSARAAEVAGTQPRGFLSGLGIGLLVGGFVGVGAGVGGLLGASDATTRLGAYGTGAVTAEDQPTVTALQQRQSGQTVLAVVGFTAGGLALAGGIACLVLDRPKVLVAVAPVSEGGVLVFSGRF